MKKLVIIAGIFLSFFLATRLVYGQEVAGHSALLSYNADKINTNKDFTIKKITIQKVFERFNSPLFHSVDSFVKYCQRYNIDYYLLPSIAGLESSFARNIYPDSYNPFGWGGGYIFFDSWDESINTVAKGIKENYIDQGADTVDKIAPIYAASSTWAVRVKYFQKMFTDEEEKVSLLLKENSVKL